MRCSSCSSLLDRYLEGSLSTPQLLQIAAHLGTCSKCTDILHELKVVDGLLATIRAPEPAANFTFAVMAEIRTMPQPASSRLNLAALLGGYVIIAWAIIAIWLRLAGISVQTALSNAAAALGQFSSGVHHISAGAINSFGHGTPLVTTFVLSVLTLDLAVATGVIVVYTIVRPRLAAHLAMSREV
ncbi:MAG: anti-sigma factor [Candidatus Baltobacteraceae bacterium]